MAPHQAQQVETHGPQPSANRDPFTRGGVLQLHVARGCQVQQGVGNESIEALVRVHSCHGNERGAGGGPLQDPLCVVGDPKRLELRRVVVHIQDVDRQLGWGDGGGKSEG